MWPKAGWCAPAITCFLTNRTARGAVGIQVGDADLWKQLKSGELTGISLAGIAREVPDANDPGNPRYTEKDAPGWAERLIKAVTRANTNITTEESEMDKAEVQEIVRDTLKSEVGQAVKDALKSAGAPPVEDGPTEVQKQVAAALKAAGIAPVKDELTDVEKQVAAVLKAHGIEPKEPASDATLTKTIGTQIEDAVTKALAKGVTEAAPISGAQEESML